MDSNFFSFKKLLLSYLIAGIPFAILFGSLVLFNVLPIEFNDTNHYGIKGFLITLIYIPFAGLLFTIINWGILNIGVFLYRLFSKK